MTTKEPSSMRTILGNKKELEETLARIMASPESVERVAALEKMREVAAAIKKDMTEHTTPVQDEIFAEMATDLCRTTMFFPDNPHSPSGKTDETLVTLTIKTQWGSMSYRGPRLDTQHEDAFLATMVLLSQSGNRHVYSGPILPLLRLMGIKTPCSKDYKSVLRMLTNLKLAAFRITTKNHDGMIGLINNAIIDSNHNLYIEMNQVFLDLFLSDGYYSLIELKTRRLLKGSVAKALYRFICSQSRGWTGPWSHLAIALNMMNEDTSDPARHAEVRRQLKKAITALVNAGKLEKASGFEGDRIRLAVVPLKIRKQVGKH